MLVGQARSQMVFAATLLLVGLMLGSLAMLVADAAYYESWESTRTANEVSWMQEPLLHKWKHPFSGVRR